MRISDWSSDVCSSDLEDAGIPRRIQALGDTRDVLLRHGTADDLALELVTFARLQRLELDLDARELAGAAGLLLMRVVDRCRARDRLAIGDLRRADIGVHLELALHAVDDDLEVQLAHPFDDGLAARSE